MSAKRILAVKEVRREGGVSESTFKAILIVAAFFLFSQFTGCVIEDYKADREASWKENDALRSELKDCRQSFEYVFNITRSPQFRYGIHEAEQ